MSTDFRPALDQDPPQTLRNPRDGVDGPRFGPARDVRMRQRGRQMFRTRARPARDRQAAPRRPAGFDL